MIKYDLKFGYYYIDIYLDFYKYLGFLWKYGEKIRFFEFNVLLFGLLLVGYVFIKVVRVLVKYWRLCGILVIMYLDDGWVCGDFKICKFVLDLI